MHIYCNTLALVKLSINSNWWFASKMHMVDLVPNSCSFNCWAKWKVIFSATCLLIGAKLLKLACNIILLPSKDQTVNLWDFWSVPSALLNVWIQTSTTFIQQPTEHCSEHWMNLFSTILAVNFVLLWCQFEHSEQQKRLLVAKALFAKIIFHPEVLLNAVQLRSPPAELVHCALALNIDEWKILKIPRIPAANSLLPHFRADVLLYTDLFTLSKSFSSKIRSHYRIV